MLSKNFEFLLVEDDLNDVELTETAIAQSKLKINLNVVKNGEEALIYLRQEDPYTEATRPNLILVDLNLSNIFSGLEVVSAIKSDLRLKALPVVVLTSSDKNKDILESYEAGANCYITKPVGLKEFIQIVNALENFWFTVVRLPTSSSY